ncbi:MAG: nucleotide sugar dehydrogenase [Candidatus Nezhaarchaeales archaeon]
MKAPLTLPSTELAASLRSGEIPVAAIGCGWMGLPTALLLAEAGVKVIGVVKEPKVASLLNSGISHIFEPGVNELLSKHVKLGRFKATVDTLQATLESGVAIITVPTLIDVFNRPDYSAVEDACLKLGRGIRKGFFVLFESTVAPGTTEGVVKRILEEVSGLKAGSDFGLAYSPIRASAGSVLRDLTNYPRIVAGIDPLSLEVACVLLSLIVKAPLVRVSNIKTAEAVKVFENVYRDVNIALANELALYCEKEGIDVVEAFKAATTQPYCHLHNPGPGPGGHCIPVNPYFLIRRAESLGLNLKIVSLAREVNDSMPSHVVELVIQALRECGKELQGSKIAMLGISYKEDVKEARFSPSVKVADHLINAKAFIVAYDPYFTPHEVFELTGLKGANSVEECVRGADCILVMVGHREFKNINLSLLSPLVNRPAALVDTRGIISPEEAKNQGFTYKGIGRL